MQTWSKLLIAGPVAAALLAATPAAHADWHHGGWHGHEGHDHDDGGAVAATVLGLGAVAVLGGIIASQQPQYYAPPPQYYAAPPPVVYAPPPGYYPQY